MNVNTDTCHAHKIRYLQISLLRKAMAAIVLKLYLHLLMQSMSTTTKVVRLVRYNCYSVYPVDNDVLNMHYFFY